MCAARQAANRLSESGEVVARGVAAAGCAPGDANAAPGMSWEETMAAPVAVCWASRRAMAAFVPARDMLLFALLFVLISREGWNNRFTVWGLYFP